MMKTKIEEIPFKVGDSVYILKKFMANYLKKEFKDVKHVIGEVNFVCIRKNWNTSEEEIEVSVPYCEKSILYIRKPNQIRKIKDSTIIQPNPKYKIQDVVYLEDNFFGECIGIVKSIYIFADHVEYIVLMLPNYKGEEISEEILKNDELVSKYRWTVKEEDLNLYNPK